MVLCCPCRRTWMDLGYIMEKNLKLAVEEARLCQGQVTTGDGRKETMEE